MTTLTLLEAARAALDAMKRYQVKRQDFDRFADEITNLRDAIEATESAKPVAMLYQQDETGRLHVVLRDEAVLLDNRWHMAGPLYLHPPEPARQPMTAGEFSRLMRSLSSTTKHRAGATAFGFELVRAVEAFHRIGVKTVGPESQRQRKDPEPEIAFLRRVADARQQVIDGMIAERCAKQDAEMPRPLADWHEDDGAVVWWKLPVDEPAWIGTPLDDGWPGYHTHWTPHPKLPERER